jgi:hypothetical protein
LTHQASHWNIEWDDVLEKSPFVQMANIVVVISSENEKSFFNLEIMVEKRDASLPLSNIVQNNIVSAQGE